MSRILITGGAGFIASELAEKLSRDPENKIVIVDNLQTGSRRKIPKGMHDNIKFIKCDVNRFKDISAVFFRYKFDYIFHYAALVGVKRTLENPVKVLDDINGIRNILDLSKNTGVKRVFYSSSSEVYGEPVEIPQNEDTTPLNSKLPYAIVKNIGEAFLRSYHVEYDLDYTIFRFFNTYGCKQSPDFVISKFIRAALKNEDLTIYGEGNQTRTFCYVDDNVDAVIGSLKHEDSLNNIINIGSNVEESIKSVALKIIRITGSKSKLIHLPPLEEGDMTRRMPDNSKMMSILGRDLLPLEEGIKNILNNTSYILD